MSPCNTYEQIGLFRRRALKKTKLKWNVQKEAKNKYSSNVEKKESFLNIKSYKPILVDPLNKIRNINKHNRGLWLVKPDLNLTSS